VEASLGTTNVFLGIMAFTSALEALIIIGVGIALIVMYRRANAVYREVMDVIRQMDARHVAPAMVRVNAILDDVKDVTATVKRETDNVDHAIRTTKGRVVGIAKGAGMALRALLRYAA
jgi:hypothetical protein